MAIREYTQVRFVNKVGNPIHSSNVQESVDLYAQPRKTRLWRDMDHPDTLVCEDLTGSGRVYEYAWANVRTARRAPRADAQQQTAKKG